MKNLKKLIDQQEKQNEELAKLFHSEILPNILVTKMNLYNRLKKALSKKLNPNNFEQDMEPLNNLAETLCEIMNNLFPPLLSYYGPITSFKNFTYSYAIKNTIVIKVNCAESTEKLPYKKLSQIHIFNLLKAVTIYFVGVSNRQPITVTISIIEENLIVEFIRTEKVNSSNFQKQIFEASIEIIEARMLLTNASFGKSVDWCNFIQLIIPIEQ